MNRRISIAILFILMFFLLLSNVSYAENAEVLPKGVVRLSVDYNYYFPTSKRFDPDGNTEDAAIDFNANLNSIVFPDLEVFGPEATVGNSIVSFEYHTSKTELSFQYGITDRLSLGVNIPYWRIKNEVDARLDTSNANIGKNVAFNTLAPLIIPGTVPLTNEDIQNLLGKGLDINGDGTLEVQGYGFKRFETSTNSGLGDIEAGLRYQYLKTEKWRLAGTVGAAFATGDVDDPDNLVDWGIGTGAPALIFMSNNDYVGIKNLILNASIRYDLVLPDEQVLRIPEDIHQPITANKEEVDRDVGDLLRAYLSATYMFFEGISFEVLYEYHHKFKDDISGKRNFPYDQLEKESDYTQHLLIGSLAYSGIELYREKKIPFPFTASISYRNKFAGTNNVLKSQYIGLNLAVFF